MSAAAASNMLKKMNEKLHEEYDGDDMFTWQYALFDGWKRGRGPLAFIFGFGYMYVGWVFLKKKFNEKFSEFLLKREAAKKEKEEEKKKKEKQKKKEEKKNNKKKKKKKKENKDGEEEEEEGDGEGSGSEESEASDGSDEEENPEEKSLLSDDALLREEEEERKIREGDEEYDDLEEGPLPEDISDSAEIFDALHGLIKADSILDAEYASEMRMVIHFQLLTIVSAKSRVEKESVEFQMFLRENRFKLMANGKHLLT